MTMSTLILTFLLAISSIKPMAVNNIKFTVHMLPIFVPYLLEIANYRSENVGLQSVFNVMKSPYCNGSLAGIYF